MDIRSIPKQCKVVPILAYASGTADRTSDVIDHLGFRRCTILVGFGTIAAGGTNSIFLQHADAASNETTLTSGADVLGSLQTIVDTDDNNWKFMDFEPSKRYSQLNVDKDTANACAEFAVAILYNATNTPVTLAAGTSTIGEGTGTVAGEYLGLLASGTK
jgi:hypothetical protein